LVWGASWTSGGRFDPEYNNQDYLRDEKLKLQYEIGQLLQQIRPLRKRLEQTENRLFSMDPPISSERREQVRDLRRESDQIKSGHDELKGLFARPALSHLSGEVRETRNQLVQLHDIVHDADRELAEIRRKIHFLSAPQQSGAVAEQRSRIAKLREVREHQTATFDQLKQKEKKYISLRHQ
jgi:predicted  nucleic acid-binding Zn-ribbon protein